MVAIVGAVTTTATCSSGAWSQTIDYGIADGSVLITADHQMRQQMMQYKQQNIYKDTINQPLESMLFLY
jgi:hypothetical protein